MKKREDKNIYVKGFSCKKNSSREFGESHENIIIQCRLSFDGSPMSLSFCPHNDLKQYNCWHPGSDAHTNVSWSCYQAHSPC